MGDNLFSSLPASTERQEVTVPNVSLSLTSAFGTAPGTVLSECGR